jgi:hypothetical protein
MVIKRKNIQLIVNALPVLTGVSFFLLTFFTPLVSDDLWYAFITFSGERVASLSDVFVSQHIHYLEWGGRTIAHFFVQLFMFFGEKNIFNLANTIVYCAFILLMQFHITGSLKKINSLLFFVVSAILWLAVPAYGQNFLWLTGSCNYLWTTTFILLFLVPFRKKQDDPNFKLTIPLSLLFFFSGVFAGWSIENSGAAVFFLLIAYFIGKFRHKEKPALFEIIGSIGFLAGFFMLIAAPGNFERASLHSSVATNPFFEIITWTYTATRRLFLNSGFLLVSISILVGYELIFHQKKKVNPFIIYYFIAGLAGIYSMAISPFFPDRACLISIVFFCISSLSLLRQLGLPDLIKRNIPVFFCLFVVYFSFSFLVASKDIIGTYNQMQSRIHYIQDQKEKGMKDLELKMIRAWDTHNTLGKVRNGPIYEISVDTNYTVNVSTSRYFEINSIKGVYPEKGNE